MTVDWFVCVCVCNCNETKVVKKKLVNNGLSDEGCATSNHLKWGPLPPNYVGRIAQHVRKGDGRKGGRDRLGLVPRTSYVLPM